MTLQLLKLNSLKQKTFFFVQVTFQYRLILQFVLVITRVFSRQDEFLFASARALYLH